MRRLTRLSRRGPLPRPLRSPARGAAELRYGLERTLHDGAVAEISALTLELGVISAATDDEDVRNRLAEAQGRITSILGALRDVGSVIYPPVLATTGLGPGLRAVAESRGLRLWLDLPRTELGDEARSRTGLLIADHFHTLRPGSVVRVRVRGRRLIRVRITDRQPGGGLPRERRAVLRCA
ncbi:histidine kinase [Saccharomonospora sp. NPDC006951]